MKLPRPVLMMVTRPAENLDDIVDAAVRGGVNVVQLRDKSASRTNICAEARRLRDRIEKRALLIVNREVIDFADGVHLPEDAPLAGAPIVGRSVHSVEAAIRAADEGADYLLAGTIFPSPSHPRATAAGLALIEQICARVSIPVVAIGGVTPTNARSCMHAGADGVAVLSSLMDSSNPSSMATEYWRAIA